ncbi:class I adenylate-forming enzyme family protein [Maricurvus nonylphenolicus]|uniref:class I adenylate-forming enzyme family protein n=1 Tax=Maricurvus nonylphenolicus TaxID=1008307 RepID=UPI0036F2156B
MIITPKTTSAYYRQQGLWADRQLHELLFEHADLKGTETALVDPANKQDLTGEAAQRFTFNEVADAITQLCARLFSLGIRQDDILLVQMPNIAELAFLYLAASRLGAIISPVPMQYQENELTDIIALLKPAAVIGVATFKHEDAMVCLLNACEQENHNARKMSFGQHGKCDQLTYQGVDKTPLQQSNHYCENRTQSGDDIFTICWTSGTEGAPKGIPRSHNQWLTVGLATYQGNRIQAGETLLNPFPFINMASIGGLFLSWLYSGGKLVLHHPLELPVFLRQLVEEEVSYTLAPPALLNGLLKNEALLAQCDFSRLRAIGSGSAPLDDWMVEGFKQRFNIEIVNHFGSNEGVCLLCGPDHTQSPHTRARLFPRAHDTLITRLIDPLSEDEITTPGKEGELQIKGPSVFDGYFRQPEKTLQSFTEDGYYKTGDIFAISTDDDRFYEFVGRSKDLIIRGGMNIAPAELDNLISSHPDIAEAAVAGYHCDIMGERIAAYIVPKEGNVDKAQLSLEDIVSFLKEQKVAVYKLPEHLEILSSLPRNPLGKVMRNQLREAR